MKNSFCMETRSSVEICGWLKNSLKFAQNCIPHLVNQPKNYDFEKPSFKREKFVAETGLLLYAAWTSAKQFPDVCESIQELASELQCHARSELILASMKIRPMAAAELAVGHLCLSYIGLPNENFQKDIEKIFSSSELRMFERVPWPR